ncbi:MAG: SRPBCC domain-containing protein [Chitinophagaceae bacterium]|nr:SRPBCC domain-containing protein [Chitinophagaceae bacterium]
MTTTDFSISETVKSSPDEAFKAITERIPDWWSKHFEGAAVESGQIFKIGFDANMSTFKKMRIGAIEAGRSVEWECIDSYLNVDFLNNRSEWIGTKMIWTVEPSGTGSRISITHEGLNAELECYEVCEAGWQQFFGSLVNLLNTGKGHPFN